MIFYHKKVYQTSCVLEIGLENSTTTLSVFSSWRTKLDLSNMAVLTPANVTHPSSWNGAPDIRLVTKVLVCDVILRADEHTTRSLTAARHWNTFRFCQPAVLFKIICDIANPWVFYTIKFVSHDVGHVTLSMKFNPLTKDARCHWKIWRKPKKVL